MQSPAESSGPTRETVRAALLDYARSPGKHQVALRQPRLLFTGLRDALHIAVGREAEGVVSVEPVAVRDAARFFIRTALLYPGADHYALLGLDSGADASDIKDRYRLMMRLLHPDFAGPGSGAWPDDAAVRINRAYDALSSPVQRLEYDTRVPPAHAPPIAPRPPAPRVPAVHRRSSGEITRSRLKVLVAVCAVVGVAFVVGGIVSTGTDGGHLVQRAHIPSAPLKIATSEAPSEFAPEKTAAASPPQIAAPARAMAIPVAVAQAPKMQSIAEPVRSAPVAPLAQLAPAPAPPPAVSSAVSFVPPITTPVTPPVAAPSAPPVPQVVAVARPALKPGPTLMEAQPLLSQLLQVMESGRGERILNLLDAEAREKPSAQALSRQYDLLVNGAQPVRLSHVEFKAEPADGRLLVVGYLRLQAGEQPIGSMGQKMVVRAEFASRSGNIVITALSGGPAN